MVEEICFSDSGRIGHKYTFAQFQIEKVWRDMGQIPDK